MLFYVSIVFIVNFKQILTWYSGRTWRWRSVIQDFWMLAIGKVWMWNILLAWKRRQILKTIMYNLIPVTCLNLCFCFQRSVSNFSLSAILPLSYNESIFFWSYVFLLLMLQDAIIKGETPLLWPLWFRAAVPGNISLYITIYYEIEDTSSTMRYRTLCMHHNLQVFRSILLMKMS